MPDKPTDAAALRRERMTASPRFENGVFRNTHPVAQGLKKGTVLPTLGEYLCGGQRRTPKGPMPILQPFEAWARPPETGLRTTWLGHSTVLVEIDGHRVLTDPVWGERVSPVSFAGPKRFHPAPVPIAALPALDAVIVSHDHYDHLDAPTIAALAGLGVPFVTSLGVGAHLEAFGVPPERIVELDWWESFSLPGGDLRITAAPSQHFSGRGVKDRNRTAWSSFHVRGPRHGVFFSGDTGLTPEYTEIRKRLGPMDLVMLEVGAFHAAWGDIHLGPENALEALRLLGGGALLPVHWGTFNLALHAWDEPPETLLRLAPAQGARLVMPRLGQAVEPARFDRVEPWWRGVDGRAPEPDPKTQATPEAVQAAESEIPWPID
jgi:L-ascorbate metabolism protein UlaG (beta-lactamase superfamily)